MAFVIVANLDDLEPGETLFVEGLREPICLVRLDDDDVRAVHNTCTHQQQPLHEGRLDDDVVERDGGGELRLRAVLAQLVGALVPDGALLYETFAQGNARYRRPANPDFLLRENELLDVVRGQLTVVAFEQVSLRSATHFSDQACGVDRHRQGKRLFYRHVNRGTFYTRGLP